MWKKFMEDNEQQSKLIRSNADQLELLCTGRILQLHQDKKKFKRIYQEEHSKLSSRISYVSLLNFKLFEGIDQFNLFSF